LVFTFGLRMPSRTKRKRHDFHSFKADSAYWRENPKRRIDLLLVLEKRHSRLLSSIHGWRAWWRYLLQHMEKRRLHNRPSSGYQTDQRYWSSS
jgi:hypothetical protein